MAKSKAPETKPAKKEEEKKTESSKDKKSIKGDLDAMFKSTKSKAIKKNKPEKAAVKAEPAKKPSFEKDEKKKGGRTKYTQEGYKIYSAAELKLGQGGDTADCPFDCDCCF